MMFDFIIRYFGFLKRVPMLAWIADAIMMIGYSFFKPKIAKVIDDIEEEVSQWEGITTSIHRYGGRQFNYNNKELGHIHSNGVLDILFSRSLKAQLVNEGLAREHHIFKKSGWVSFYIQNVADYKNAIQLLKLAREYRMISAA